VTSSRQEPGRQAELPSDSKRSGPTEGTFHRLGPAIRQMIPLSVADTRGPALVLGPELPDLVEIRPQPHRETGRIRGTESSRLGHLGPDDVDPEHVGLELHEEIV